MRTTIEAILLNLFDIPPTPPFLVQPLPRRDQCDPWGCAAGGIFYSTTAPKKNIPLDIYVPIGGFSVSCLAGR